MGLGLGSELGLGLGLVGSSHKAPLQPASHTHAYCAAPLAASHPESTHAPCPQPGPQPFEVRVRVRV